MVKKKTDVTKVVSDVSSSFDLTFQDYKKTLTPRLKLIDSFLAFLVALGGLQFVYVIVIGNFPFNAFLGGFISCVGEFVLTVNLRLQYNDKAGIFQRVSPERAFGDYIFASLILHFAVYHFIN